MAHLWDCPDIVRQYLETGDESIREAAHAAAWDAARAAAGASLAAAWDATRPAAEAAAGASLAAAGASLAAACDKQRERLLSMIAKISGRE